MCRMGTKSLLATPCIGRHQESGIRVPFSDCKNQKGPISFKLPNPFSTDQVANDLFKFINCHTVNYE